MFDQTEIDTLRGSVLVLHYRKETAVEKFYDKLFELSPDLRDLFPAQVSGQARKFAATLVVAVNSLSEWDTLLPVIEALARRHLVYGVKAEHYKIVELALVETLRDLEADPKEIETWKTVYRTLADHMVSVAYPEQL